MPSKSDFLVVNGENIELNGKPIILKGAGLGGWSEQCCFRHAYMAHRLLTSPPMHAQSEHGGEHAVRHPQ
jgi:hypothetical protein